MRKTGSAPPGGDPCFPRDLHQHSKLRFREVFLGLRFKQMTGAELRRLRNALGLELPWFASLLGLHAAKLERWEASEEVSLHPLQAHIVSILTLQVRLLGARAPVLGKRILVGVMLYGPPYGMLVLLQAHFDGVVLEFVPSTPREHSPPDGTV